MNLFFDTSALVKFFHEEEGTEAVTELMLDANFVATDDSLCGVAEPIGYNTVNPLKTSA